MTEKTALKRRIAPSVPLRLELTDDSGGSFARSFRLCFDFNAIALVEERTGYSLLTGEIWQQLKSLDARIAELEEVLRAPGLTKESRERAEADLRALRDRADQPRPGGGSSKLLSIMLWAAILANHHEYDSDEGLAAIRSYMDAGNIELITRALSDAFILSLPKERQEAIRKMADAKTADPTPPQPEEPPLKAISA